MELSEILKVKRETEQTLIEFISGKIEEFQEKTQIGVQNVDIILADVTHFGSLNSFMIQDVKIKLDID